MTTRPLHSPQGARPTLPAPPLGKRTGVGVVVPCDMALDRELWRWAPDDVDLHLTRLRSTPTAITMETVQQMGDADLVAQAVQTLSPVQPAATLYACTSGSFVRGRAGERALVEAMTNAGAARAVTTSGALLAALVRLGVSAVGVATPYDAAITARLAGFLSEGTVDVVATKHLGLLHDIWTVPYDVTAQLVRDADHPDAEAVVVSCTNLPTYDLIADLEAELGKPVVTANQASMWAVLEAVGRAAHGPGQRLVAAELHNPAPTTKGSSNAGT